MSSTPPLPSTPVPSTPTSTLPTPPTPPAQPNGKDAMYDVMQKLYANAQVVKSGHFIAAQRKARHAKRVGVIVIVLNVLIGSGLIEAFVPEPQGTARAVFTPATVIKLLAFIAAALAGIQTFFNFQTEVECHTNAGNVYTGIRHRLDRVMGEYLSRTGNRDDLIEKYRALDDEFLAANEKSKGCIPSDGDYREARKEIEGRRG